MDFDPADFDLHEDCVSVDDAVDFVFENHWDAVEEAVRDAKAKEWLSQTKPCLEILSIVSQRDRAHTRGTIKKWLRQGQNDTEQLTEAKLFSIAADISGFLEQLPHPLPPAVHLVGSESSYHDSQEPTASRCIGLSAGTCNLEGDLSWASDLLALARAFRDFLSAVSDPDLEEPLLRFQIMNPIRTFNAYLLKAPAYPLVYWWDRDDRQLRFGRRPDPKFSNLTSYIANWISDYLNRHCTNVGLGVCVECGKFFVRERRDKTFCSKTCQNRVAYNRKKILESGALVPLVVAPEDACDIKCGLWIHHPRFGLGLIEAVGTGDAPFRAISHVGASIEAVDVRYKAMLSRRVALQVRFLPGVRTLKYSDLFEGEKKDEQVPTFYEVKSEETLAELL